MRQFGKNFAKIKELLPEKDIVSEGGKRDIVSEGGKRDIVSE